MDDSLLPLATMPHYHESLGRMQAWLAGAEADRPPVRFSSFKRSRPFLPPKARPWKNEEERWMDAEYVVDHFCAWMDGARVSAESFPVFWPNLGPDVYAALFGFKLRFSQATSWVEHSLPSIEEAASLHMDLSHPCLAKLDEMTNLAMARSNGRFLVGYTDLHPGMDCVAAWRSPQQLCLDIMDRPEAIPPAMRAANADFTQLFRHCNQALKGRGAPSVNWMGIPSNGLFHTLSCDFSSLISSDMFEEFALPTLCEEAAAATDVVFHIDGKDVARHIDLILKIPGLQAVQWVQGTGRDSPIMLWTDFIKKVQNAGKSIIVELHISELQEFMNEMHPKGILLWINGENPEDHDKILADLSKWR